MERKDKKRNEWIREKIGEEDMMEDIDVMKWCQTCHITGKMENDNRWAKNVLSGHLE